MAFYVALLGFLLQVIGLAVVLVEPGFESRLPATPMLLTTFWLAFVIVALIIAALIYLWIAMLHFLLTYDACTGPEKALWFAVLLFGSSYGAALYYAVVFRKCRQQALLLPVPMRR